MLPASAPPALAQVAQRYFETSRGVVTFRLHRVFEVHGGFSSRHEDLVLEGIYENGVTVRVRVHSYAIDGKAASAADVSSLEESWNHPKAGDVFAPPFDPRHLDEYQYESAGPSALAFASNVRDAGHGRGILGYDAQYDVVSVSFQPNVLPPHASSGQITQLRAQVLPGYWATTQETQSYRGSYGPFAAAGTLQLTFTNFRRFPDVASALRSL
jgi:hypothetical protein